MSFISIQCSASTWRLGRLGRLYQTRLFPFNGHFPGDPGLAGFIEVKDDGSGGDNWSCKSCKAPVRLSPPTNQHPTFYRPDALVPQPTVSCICIYIYIVFTPCFIKSGPLCIFAITFSNVDRFE